MKVHTILEAYGTNISQRYLWHITEKANVPLIRKEQMLLPKSRMRGAQYKDNRLHFITTNDPEAVEEIESLVRFGGIDFEDNETIAKREEVQLVLLKIDLKEVEEFDEQMEWSRKWHKDEGVSEGIGVWTNRPIPISAMTIEKTL